MKTCKKCKAYCCTYAGYVTVSEEDCKRLAEKLRTSPAEFRRVYTKKIPEYNDTPVLKKLGTNEFGPCIFVGLIEDEEGVGFRGCTVYGERPNDCKKYSLRQCKEDGYFSRIAQKDEPLVLDMDKTYHAELPKDKLILVHSRDIKQTISRTKELLAQGYHALGLGRTKNNRWEWRKYQTQADINININIAPDGKIKIKNDEECEKVKPKPEQSKEPEQKPKAPVRTPQAPKSVNPETKNEQPPLPFIPKDLQPIIIKLAREICSTYYETSVRFLIKEANRLVQQRDGHIKETGWMEQDEQGICSVTYGDGFGAVNVHDELVFKVDNYAQLIAKFNEIVHTELPNEFFRITPKLVETISRKVRNETPVKDYRVVLYCLFSELPQNSLDKEAQDNAAHTKILKETEVRRLVQDGLAKFVTEYSYELI